MSTRLPPDDLPLRIAAEFPLEPGLCYLNHAGVAPWPARARDAVAAFAAANVHRGAADYPDWLQLEARLRGQLARLVNAPSPADIALLKNTSEGLSLVAAGLPWRPGDRVLLTGSEFPSNRLPWEALAARGVVPDLVALQGADPTGDLIAALRDDTRVVAVSAVQYACGLRLDLARLGAACRAHGALFVVDAIQQVGALPFDVQACHADIAVADGHKWMCGPEGLALFYVREGVRDRLALQQFGWHMREDAGNYASAEWTPARSARRFECGSPNMLGAHALSASLSLLEEVGMDAIGRQVLANTAWLMDAVAALPGWRLVSRTEDGLRSGIVTFRHGSADHAAVARALRARGIICAERGGGIRYAPHFHTHPSVLAAAVAALAEAVPR